jgi:KDO2-lipid IV(A) lauroyltransferase
MPVLTLVEREPAGLTVMAKHGPARNAVEFGLVWSVLQVFAWLPLPVVRLLVSLLGRLLYLATRRWRVVARSNLEFAMPELDPVQREEVIRGVYENLGRVVLSVARMPRLTPANIGRWIQYEGFEHYQRALEKGRGVLFMTAHLGNWELSAFAHALFGNPMHVMVRPLDNPWLDRLVDRYRRRAGNQTIRKQDAGLKVLRALRNNEAVGILIDQNTTERDRVFVDFFGRKASAGSAFVKLAQRSGAVVIPGFALWRPESGRYVLKFYPPLEWSDSGDADRDLVDNTQRCHSMLEQVIREQPEQWLWIHRRWKTQPERTVVTPRPTEPAVRPKPLG